LIRVGLGKDLHVLESGRPLLLAGVVIPSEKGETGHSDGDVLAHAVCDALLGAAALDDIGARFPDTDSRWKDADSMALLRQCHDAVKRGGWRVANLDCVIELQTPRVFPYREAIRAALARALDADVSAVFVKAKTGEGLGPIGEGAAVAAEAVCLLEN
jgi:2-C-methyl-D-erythritol 2,4-cyclodiphosphate synthase